MFHRSPDGCRLECRGPATRPFPPELAEVPLQLLHLCGRSANPEACDPLEFGDLPLEGLVGGAESAHMAVSLSIWALWSFEEKSTKTLLISVNSSIAALPASRPPFPVFLTPPNGSCTSAPIVGALM